jgi:hypothetical protein
MEAYIRDNFFSRQGKATKHLFDSFKSVSRQESIDKVSSSPEPINPITFLEKLVKERQEEKILKERSIKFSSFFTSVGRDSYSFSSSTPGVGQYSPSYSALDPRTNQGPKYFKPIKKKKKPKIFLPRCINSNLECKILQSEPYGNFIPLIHRTVHNLEDYEENLKKIKSLTPIPEKITKKITASVSFDSQISRDPFVKLNSGPNEKRFDYSPSKSDILQRFNRPLSVDFSKNSPRTEKSQIFAGGPYDKNKEYVLPKLAKNIPDFSKQLKRKPLLLEHLLKNPNSPDLNRYDKSFNNQGNIKGPKKIPLMHTTRSRDDSMYK